MKITNSPYEKISIEKYRNHYYGPARQDSGSLVKGYYQSCFWQWIIKIHRKGTTKQSSELIEWKKNTYVHNYNNMSSF